MSITNINLLPKLEDIENLNKDMQDFYIQSLANLGQRLGVKGDSIQCGSFIFRDILGEIGEAYNSDNHVGVIEKENGIVKLYIANKNTLLPISTPEYITKYQNTLVFDSTKGFETSIGKGKRYYKPNSYITTLKNNRFVFCGISEDHDYRDDIDKSEFIYEEFDKNTEELISGLRICEFKGKPLAITFSKTINNKCNIEIFNINSTLNKVLEKIDYKIKTLYRTSESLTGIINESKIKAISVNYWIDYLHLNRIGSNYKKYANIEYNLEDTDFTIKTNDNLPIPENEVIYLFHYDKKETLDQLKEYFTTEIYNFDNLSFKKQIVYNLFSGIYSSNGKTSVPNNTKLYIPVEFIFNYYCNSNDQWKIYGGIQDIHVRFVESGTLNRGNFDTYYRDDQLIGFIDSEENQSALYNYSVEYSNDNKFVYKIVVERKYALPYVNSDGYWVINDDPTNISASGKNAGNPNIIIVYSLTNNQVNPQEGIDFKILTSFDNEVLNNLSSTWKLTSTQIEPIEKINLENPSIVIKSNLYKIGCYVPDLERIDSYKNELFSKLEYALIINISSINCFEKLDNRIIETYGEEGVVTTLWKLNANKTKFEEVKNPKFDKTLGTVALDIVHLTNLNNLVKWHIMNHEPKHPDRYTNSWLVFDNAKKETKNLVNDYRSYVYPIIANKSADEYYSGNYRNDFNLTFKFYDMVDGAENQNIQSISNSSTKYLTSSNINVTNTLYNRRLESNSIFKNFEEYVPNIDMPMLDLSEVLTKDQNLLNRANIISLSNKGDLFYSYIGTAFDDEDKNRIHIGSSNININLGTETMVPLAIQDNLFKKSTEIDIDFDNTKINGYAYVLKDLQVENDIRTGHINWEVRKMGDKTVYSTSFIPTSKLMIQKNPNETIQNFMQILQFNNYRKIPELNYNSFINEQIKRYYNGATFATINSSKYDAKLWIPAFYYIEYPTLFKRNKMIYLGELLFLPTLLYRLDLFYYVVNMNKIVSVKSNMRVIKYQNTPLMLVTTNKFLEDLDYKFNGVNSKISLYETKSTDDKSIDDESEYNKSKNNIEINFSIDTNESYTGNTLEIAYYIDQSNNLHLTINELGGHCHYIENLFKLKLEY